MNDVKLIGTFDVAELVFLTFVLFFLALLFYLRREDRREGYPLEDEVTGRIDTMGGVLSSATPKTFAMPFGQPVATTPTKGREPTAIAAERTFRSSGAPYAPTGDPYADGIGPAAWAERARTPDLDATGANRIVPMSMMPSMHIDSHDADPHGMAVIGADGAVAGIVVELWVDRAEHVIRYFEVETPTGVRVLAPMPMAKVKGRSRQIVIDAINADRFAMVPQISIPGQISRYEEERICAYFGGGYLYANAARQEPLI